MKLTWNSYFFSTLFIACFSVISLKSQNLVKNPSFEIYNLCPNDASQISRATGWGAYSGTPDYYNSCTVGNFSTPLNSRGRQSPFDGQAYASITVYDPAVLKNGTINEILLGELTSPLQIGKTYNVAFRVNLTDGSGFAIQGLGMSFFTTSAVSGLPIPAPDFLSSITVTDKDNWITISGTFTPLVPNLSYFAIGNFNINALTKKTPVNGPQTIAHYYIDDVYVGTDAVLLPVHAEIKNATFKICENSCANFKDTLLPGTAKISHYKWKFPGALKTIDTNKIPGAACYPNQGQYDVGLVVTDSLGRQDSTLLKNVVIVNQSPMFSLGIDTILPRGRSVKLSPISNSTNNSFVWNDLSNKKDLTITKPGIYWLKISNECGSYSDTIEFKEPPNCFFKVPEAFSANTTSSFKEFQPNYSCDPGNITKYHIDIYNRWGQIVFSSDNIEKSWDGKSDNQDCPIGVYVYMLSYTAQDGDMITHESLKGLVTLSK